MSEQVTEADLQAYADGKLADERRAAVEAWLAAHPEDAERIESYRRIAEELRTTYQAVLQEPVPERLSSALRPARLRGFARVAAWVALGAAIGTYVGWELHASRPVPLPNVDVAAAMARRAAVAHAIYSPEVRHPVEVGADQEQHLVAWLSKRLGIKVRAPNLEEAGMSLVGGRLLPGDIGPVAQLMYQTQNGRRLTVYLRAEASRNRETAFRYARENNVSVFYWIDGETGCALASADLSKEELFKVANAVYRQLNP